MESNIARILLNNSNSNNNNKKNITQNQILPALCQFNPSVMIDMFPGPAVLVDGDMNIHHYNVFGKCLLGSINNKETLLQSMVLRCLSNNCPDTQKTTLDNSDGLRHYDLYAFPIKQEQTNQPNMVFLFGRETTIENNLTNALVDSRQMFKDLVSCSTDFSWETDNKGNFIYVSPKGILGYTAYELNGKNSYEMIVGGNENNPFDTMDKVNDMELWLKRSDGSMACLLVSAVPVLDNRAMWQGARGVCRDITHIREREAILRRTQRREHVLGKIVSNIRDMATPATMLENTMTATLEGIDADYCCIIQKKHQPDGHFKAEIKHHKGPSIEDGLREELCQKAVCRWSDTKTQKQKTEVIQIGRYRILMGITNHHGICNGAIFLIRAIKTNHKKNDLKHDEWQENEKHLFTGITNHLGIALEQITTHEELEKLATTDELTGLLNRRAFNQEATKRILHQKRSQKTGALFYIDLDNFKNVNDTKGHAQGDEILVEISKIISESTRIGDYAARIGGDEFSIWLDDISEKDALLKAHNFVAAGSRLALLADVSGPQLSVSVGIAISNPKDNNTLKDLMENADSALYQAKSAGKASYVIYQQDNHS
ncbi:MAG: sensor domain-containing diguanylate cyclase [Emcibacter sp.]|nr:sensor domain-containing diguanylate cyclase [Emcibacter sp.]